MYISTSVPQPAWNATPYQRGQSSVFTHWLINTSTWVPGNQLRPYKRYINSQGVAAHIVTTGYVPTSAFKFESQLGSLYEAPTAAANVPIYTCVHGSTDYFDSLSSTCEGQFVLGIAGYAYAANGANELPLYRCYAPTTGDHFVSSSPTCEGQRVEYMLGYAAK